MKDKAIQAMIAGFGVILLVVFCNIISERTYAVDLATLDANGKAILVPGSPPPVVIYTPAPPPPVTLCQKVGNTTMCTTY